MNSIDCNNFILFSSNDDENNSCSKKLDFGSPCRILDHPALLDYSNHKTPGGVL